MIRKRIVFSRALLVYLGRFKNRSKEVMNKFSALLLCAVMGSLSSFCFGETGTKNAINDFLYQENILALDALRTGNMDVLPNLKADLADPRLNTQIRTVLETLDQVVAIHILREGLNFTDPLCVAGCIESLGKLKDTESVERIVDFACDSQCDRLIRCVAYRSLGRIATPEACSALIDGLKNTDQEIKLACADGLFDAGATLGNYLYFKAVREADIDEQTTRIAVQNEVLLSKNSMLLLELLRSDNQYEFKSACHILSVIDDLDDDFGHALCFLLCDSPMETSNRIVRALGCSNNKVIFEILVKLLNNEDMSESVSKVTIIQTLGNTRNPALFDVCFRFFSSENERLRNAAVESVNLLEELSEENVICIKNVLESFGGGDDEDRLLPLHSCLKVASKQKIVSLVPLIENIALSSSDMELNEECCKILSEIGDPSPEIIERFIHNFKGVLSPDAFRLCLNSFCKRAVLKSEVIGILERYFSNDFVEIAKYVGVMGGKYPADYLGNLALTQYWSTTDDFIDVLDVVTRALGEWTTPDASEALARLVWLLPEGRRLNKFKERAIRGYIRIIRQMGEPPLQKMQKIANALRMTSNRPQERELLDQLDSRFLSSFKENALFNGKDLSGWEEYESGVFRVEHGSIVVGNLETGLKHNEFLTTKKTYRNFYLRVDCKILVGDNNPSNDGNAGIQFCSVRAPDNWEMIGYQADMTSDGSYWGCLYDESRRNCMLQVPVSEIQQKVVRLNDWNTYEILVQGNNIRLFLNGVQMVDYVEENENFLLDGKIGLQIHAGGPALAYYRNIYICDVATDDSN